jgi:hypothetical protein
MSLHHWIPGNVGIRILLETWMYSKKEKLSRCTPCRRLWERTKSSYSFLTLALDGVSGQRHAPAALYLQAKVPWYLLDRRLGGLRADLDAEALINILGPCRGSNPGRPVRSQTLYWASARMDVRIYASFCGVLSFVGEGLGKGWSPIEGDLVNV